jgi:molybdopterin-binding protein
MTPALEIRGLSKSFGGLPAASDIALTVAPGERRLLIGPNGAGKTTLFNLITGDLRRDAGSIRLFGEEVAGLPAHRRVRRGLARTYQIITLFPRDTLAHNVVLSLLGLLPGRWNPLVPMRRRSDLYTAARAVLARVSLDHLAERAVTQVSYGEKRRLEIAMALTQHPRLLLLDEPLAALDGPTRDEIRPGLKRFLSQLGIPAYVVTHDRLDAIVLGERVLIIEQGRIVQSGSTPDVFAHPVNADVARLVGIETVTTGVVTAASDGVLHIAVGPAVVHAQGRAAVGAEVDICIRAEDVTLSRDDPAGMSAQNQWHARIASIVSDAGVLRVTLDCGFPLTALVTRTAGDGLGLRENAHVWAVVKATAVTALPRAARS